MTLKRVNIPYVSDNNPEHALSELEKLCNKLVADHPNEEILFTDAKITSCDNFCGGIRFTAFITVVAPNAELTKPAKSPFNPLD